MPEHRKGDRQVITLYDSDRPIYHVIRMCE